MASSSQEMFPEDGFELATGGDENDPTYSPEVIEYEDDDDTDVDECIEEEEEDGDDDGPVDLTPRRPIRPVLSTPKGRPMSRAAASAAVARLMSGESAMPPSPPSSPPKRKKKKPVVSTIRGGRVHFAAGSKTTNAIDARRNILPPKTKAPPPASLPVRAASSGGNANGGGSGKKRAGDETSLPVKKRIRRPAGAEEEDDVEEASTTGADSAPSSSQKEDKKVHQLVEEPATAVVDFSGKDIPYSRDVMYLGDRFQLRVGKMSYGSARGIGSNTYDSLVFTRLPPANATGKAAKSFNFNLPVRLLHPLHQAVGAIMRGSGMEVPSSPAKK